MKPKFLTNGDLLFRKIFKNIFKIFVKAGITPNQLTVLGGLLHIPIVVSIFYSQYIYAVLFFTIAVFFDWLDGAYARETSQTSKSGHYLDRTIDILGILSVILAFAFTTSYMFYLLFLTMIVIIAYVLHEIMTGIDMWSGVRTILIISAFLNILLMGIYAIIILTLLTIIIKIFTSR